MMEMLCHPTVSKLIHLQKNDLFIKQLWQVIANAYNDYFVEVGPTLANNISSTVNHTGACPGIRKRGGPKSESLFFFFFFAFQFFRGGPDQKLAEKMTISTKKSSKI